MCSYMKLCLLEASSVQEDKVFCRVSSLICINISSNLLVHRLLARLAKLAQWLVQKALLEINAPQKRPVRVLELCLVSILSGSVKTKRSCKIILHRHCWWLLTCLSSTKVGLMTQCCPDYHRSKIATSKKSGCVRKRSLRYITSLGEELCTELYPDCACTTNSHQCYNHLHRHLI